MVYFLIAFMASELCLSAWSARCEFLNLDDPSNEFQLRLFRDFCTFYFIIIQQDSATCEVQCLHSKLINDFDCKQKLNWINLVFEKRMVKKGRFDILVEWQKTKKTLKCWYYFSCLWNPNQIAKDDLFYAHSPLIPVDYHSIILSWVQTRERAH